MYSFLVVFALLSSINFAFGNIENDWWPKYLLKCERDVPNFNTCLYYHANQVLTGLYGGDDYVGLPQLVPFQIRELTFGETFKLNMDNIKLFGLNFIYVEHINWDLDKKNIYIKASFSNTIRLSGEFNIKGSFKNQSLDSSGVADLAFLDGSIVYNMTYSTQKINGYEYGNVEGCTGGRANEFPRFAFADVKNYGKQTANLNSLSNNNRNDFNKQLTSEMNELICKIGDGIFRRLFYNFPFEIIFDAPRPT